MCEFHVHMELIFSYAKQKDTKSAASPRLGVIFI